MYLLNRHHTLFGVAKQGRTWRFRDQGDFFFFGREYPEVQAALLNVPECALQRTPQ